MVEMTDSFKNITDFIKANRENIYPMTYLDTDSVFGFYISKKTDDFLHAILKITRTKTEPFRYSLNSKEITSDIGSYIFDTSFNHWAGTVISKTQLVLDEVSESINKYMEGIDNG